MPTPKKARIAITILAIILVAVTVLFWIGLSQMFSPNNPGMDGWLCDGPSC